MPIKLMANCHSRPHFIASHALAYDASAPPAVLPVGAFPVGDDFFVVKTKQELQSIIDTTWNSRKKLMFTGGTAVAAKTVLEKAATGGDTTYQVRWGLHQSENRPLGAVGLCLHFTLAAAPADWHCYVNTDGKRLSYMSNGPAPANFCTIAKP
jgi:hypothetical protein